MSNLGASMDNIIEQMVQLELTNLLDYAIITKEVSEVSLKYEVIIHSTNDHKRFYQIAYYRYGEWHHLTKPAFVMNSGSRWYCQYGEKHRTNGPAEMALWSNEYYHRGKQYVPT